MRKPISTQMHGVLDYLTAATLGTLPSLLNFKRPLACAVQSMAATKLLVSLFTDNELGVVRKIPMKAHLAFDAVAATGLIALPFVMENDDEVATATCVAMGAMDLIAGLMTQTTPTNRSLPRQAVRGVSNAARSASRRVTGGQRQTSGV